VTDTAMNGSTRQAQDLDALAARNKQRIDVLSASPQVLEHPAPSSRPFDQKAHNLLLQSIDQVAADWVSELSHVRHNAEQVEALVLQHATKVKADITALYLLGHAALAEAKRGDEVNAKLADELDRLAESRV
jgi:hypothetical protein